MLRINVVDQGSLGRCKQPPNHIHVANCTACVEQKRAEGNCHNKEIGRGEEWKHEECDDNEWCECHDNVVVSLLKLTKGGCIWASFQYRPYVTW